jgi:large subunit ribosomal protein L17
MRHKKLGRQFGRNTSHRRAMFRALAANLVLHERIETTEAKAKELRRVVERLITRAVRLGSPGQTPSDQLSAADKARRTATKRQIGGFLQRFATKTSKDGTSTQVDLREKLLVELGARYKDRPGGYTRIIKIGRRRGDNAPMSLIELVGSPASVDAPAKKADSAEAA